MGWTKGVRQQFTQCSEAKCGYKWSFANRASCFSCGCKLRVTIPQATEGNKVDWPADRRGQEDNPAAAQPDNEAKQKLLRETLSNFKKQGLPEEHPAYQATKESLQQAKNESLEAKGPWERTQARSSQIISKQSALYDQQSKLETLEQQKTDLEEQIT